MNVKTILKCDVCKKNKWKIKSKRLVVCQSCGLVRANVEFSHLNVKNLYKHKYYFGSEYHDYIADRKALEKNFEERIKFLSQKGVLLKTSKVIEIGCAYGFFMNLINNRVKSIIGYDLSKEGVGYAKNTFKVDARCEDFLQYDDGKVDLVCMWDVIEHLTSPDTYIKKISKIINKGEL